MSESEISHAIPSTVPLPKPALEHLPALDHIRVAGVLLVLLLHALVPYVTHKMPLLVWPVLESGGDEVLDSIFWWIECVIMPLFLLLSGFVTGRLLLKYSGSEFLEHRKRRLLYPLLFGIVFVLPFDLYAWGIGFVLHGGLPLEKLLALKFGDRIDDNLWGLSHLWYLQYVFLYSLILTGGLWVLKSYPRLHDFLKGIEPRNHWWKVTFLAVAGVVVLFWEPAVVVGFQHRFWPVPSKFLYSDLFFVGGFWLQRAEGSLDWLRKWGPVSAAGAMVVFICALPLIHQEVRNVISADERWLMCASIVCTAWFSCLGLMGCYLRWMNRKVSWISYFAAASFWMYLIHHPIIGAIHTGLAFVSLHAVLKGILSWLLTVGVTVGSYELFVRKTRLGDWLNGKRRVPEAAPVINSPALPDQKAA
ncbi:glucans biosynthesis protein [Polystyrenella longa]|uniref:Glucans biosynthesis protein n=1 Tax=Polystyrenella longa TaxID=2528007 RepID=A0A518CSC4_9PLAN|nr:acyltransferase [Polystyrenella longa]QDU82115.1 glucans biosynthesis protein [Polystyrenella longa]